MHCQIKEAIIDNWSFANNIKTFNNGDVYLYEITGNRRSFGTSYVVGDSAGTSETFEIAQDTTTVTEDRITIRLFSMTIYILTLDGDNVAFYQKLFSLNDFDVSTYLRL